MTEMNKHEVAAVLEHIGLLLELKEDNPFKARAYYNGAHIVLSLQDDLETLAREKKLLTIPGIGKALAEKIEALLLHGKLDYYEELKREIPEGLPELLKVPGLGPKKVRLLYRQLGISNLRELEYACKENRLVELPGFGAKTQGKVLQGMEFFKKFQGQYYYAEALVWARRLLEDLRKNPAVNRAGLAGSLRRAKEVVKDIDLVAATQAGAGTDREKVIEFFAGLPQVKEVLSKGDTMASVRLAEGIQADLRVVEAAEFPYALHHFTGSREHNTAMRHLAKERGYKLNEYGLWAGEEILPCRSEEELFLALGLAYIPPELRENRGEIQAAREGRLPRLVEQADLQGAFHIHTLYSDGADSLEEIAAAALRLDWQYIGISDHSQTAFYAHGLKAEDIKRQQEEIGRLRERYPQLAIFSGIEADIRPDGSLDYPDEILASFDFVIASVHSHFKMTEQDMTNRIVKAMSHPAVTMLGHATGRILLARSGYPVRVEELLEAAREYGTVMELNASPARLDLDWRHLQRAAEMGVLISINPDAHRLEELEDVQYGVAVARKGWLTKEGVFNCRSAQWMKEYFQARKTR